MSALSVYLLIPCFLGWSIDADLICLLLHFMDTVLCEMVLILGFRIKQPLECTAVMPL